VRFLETLELRWSAVRNGEEERSGDQGQAALRQLVPRIPEGDEDTKQRECPLCKGHRAASMSKTEMRLQRQKAMPGCFQGVQGKARKSNLNRLAEKPKAAT
jgi:hypothetical protein